MELTKLLRLPPDAKQQAGETASNDSRTRDQQELSNAPPDANNEPANKETPILSESRKPSNLFAGLTASRDDGDYLCPD